MNQDVTRQIWWNIPVGFVIFLYGMVIPLTAAFIYIGMLWYRMVRIGGQDARPRFDQPWRRFFLAFRDGVGQGYVGRETWGWIHYTFIVAFVGLFIGTSLVFVNDNLSDLIAPFGVRLYFYYGDFYLFFKAAMDTFFLLIIISVVAACIRRSLVGPALRADGRWYFLPVVERPVILTPGEDGYIVAECPRRPDFSVFPITCSP